MGIVVHRLERKVLYIAKIAIIVRFVSLMCILISFYWVSILKHISRTKIRNNTEEAPFGIPGARTEADNNLMFEPIVERNITFLLGIDGTLVTKLIRHCNQLVIAG